MQEAEDDAEESDEGHSGKCKCVKCGQEVVEIE